MQDRQPQKGTKNAKRPLHSSLKIRNLQSQIRNRMVLSILFIFTLIMKHNIPMRITVTNPVPGVTMQVQKGRGELVPPAETSARAVAFDFEITVDISGAVPNFLGKFAQGPKDKRFVYVNSGTYAGQDNTCWSRRAKISLMSITKKQVEEALASNGRLEAEIIGTGRDGGPMCASVPIVGGWRVVK